MRAWGVSLDPAAWNPLRGACKVVDSGGELISLWQVHDVNSAALRTIPLTTLLAYRIAPSPFQLEFAQSIADSPLKRSRAKAACRSRVVETQPGGEYSTLRLTWVGWRVAVQGANR
jgi:hypothetical protein